MPTYTFTCSQNDGLPETVSRDCQGREQAVQYARRYLEAALQERQSDCIAASISLAEGGGSTPFWFGAWEWTPESGWCWCPMD